MTNCIFCDIIAKTAAAEILYEDDRCVVITNINPIAPVHLLILPRKHVASLNEMTSADEALAGHLLLTAKAMAEKMGISEYGYRLAVNTGRGGGQTVFHLHIHLLGGKPMDDSLLARGIA